MALHLGENIGGAKEVEVGHPVGSVQLDKHNTRLEDGVELTSGKQRMEKGQLFGHCSESLALLVAVRWGSYYYASREVKLMPMDPSKESRRRKLGASASMPKPSPMYPALYIRNLQGRFNG